MEINFSFDKDFDKFWEELKNTPHYKELATLDGIGEQTDMVSFSKKFFGKTTATADVSVDSNANVEDSSVIAYEVEVAKPLFRMNAYYLLWKYAKKLYGKKEAERLCRCQFEKSLYINDFHKFAVCPYCFNFSCLDVVFSGLPFVKKIKSEPPQHLSSFMGQMIQFVTYASNSVAGAVGLADLFICMAYFVDREENFDNDVRQELQSFIYSVNQPFRGGHQSAFTNVSLMDKEFLTKLCSEYTFPDGSHPNIETVQKLQRMFMKMMNKTLSKTPCTFPVTTACFAVNDKREVIDKDFLHEIMEANQEYGWINIYAGKTSTLSSCCRLRSESDNEYFNSFGAGGTKIGSMSVTTLNLPRIAYLSKGDRQVFFEQLKAGVQAAAEINNVKRIIVEKRIKNGNLPLYSLGFMDIRKQYSTCGLCGINEACEIMGYNILGEDGIEFVTQILKTVNKENKTKEAELQYPHNCEQTPSENSAIKMAQADKILGNNNDYPLYSNQFIPLTTQADVLNRVLLQGLFDKYMTGGAILHVNIGEKIKDVSLMEDFVKASIKAGVIYQAINYVLNVCKQGHISVGREEEKCPQCGEKIIEKLTRVVGFLTSVKNWHKVRRDVDFPNRQFY